jgi:SAM-dependent methyltransferase
MSSEFNLPLNDYGFEASIEDSDDYFRVLDMGCGEAEYHQKLKEDILEPRIPNSEVEIYGIDSDQEAIESARSLNGNSEGYNYFVADATETDFEDDFFDMVVSQHLACRIEQTDGRSIEDDLIPESERVANSNELVIHECP